MVWTSTARRSRRGAGCYCTGVASKFEDLWRELNVQYDWSVRTTSARHKEIVREFMKRVWESGDIYRSEYEGLYRNGCEEYKDQKDLVEGVCPLHPEKCEEREEEDYFFCIEQVSNPA